jgi:predicted dehydrogenase
MGQNHRTRVGIAGLDHFFAGLEAVRELQQDAQAELVIIAHRDPERARQTAERAGARWTTSYEEVVDADIDLLITGCPTSRNAALVTRAAQQGKHVLSVKPFAMNMTEAGEILAAVEKAGVHFMSFDAGFRLNPLYRQVKTWLQEGRFGQPISAFCLLRSAMPEISWLEAPLVRARTWWLDPDKVPGGGWIDHAIYYVDVLRWLLDTEAARVSGEIAHLKHVAEPLEDFGVATVVFKNQSIATIEVTWTAEFSGLTTAFHLVGTGGQLLSESIMKGALASVQQQHRVIRIDYSDPVPGWQSVEALPVPGGMTTHMLRVLRGQEEPIAGPQDSRATLATCLAFYEAAHELRAVELKETDYE